MGCFVYLCSTQPSVVAQVQIHSVADSICITPTDTIVAINHTSVTSVWGMYCAMLIAPHKLIQIVWKHGNAFYTARVPYTEKLGIEFSMWGFLYVSI
jgi:hypothetical protein